MENPRHFSMIPRPVKIGGAFAAAFGLVYGASWTHGAADAIADSSIIEHTSSASAHIDVPPSITKAEYLNKTVFVRFNVATAVTASIEDKWVVKPTVAGVALPEIAVTGTTTATYNARLKKAKEEGTPIDLKTVDQIRIEGAFKDTIQQAYYPSAKRMADRTPAEKADPNNHRILELIIEGKDLDFTPVVNPDPFSYAQAFVTREDVGADFGNLTDSVKKAFGWDGQTFMENRQLTAQQLVYLTGVKGGIEACEPEVMNSPELASWVTNGIKKIVVGSYNQTHVEHITDEDVLVTVKPIDTKVNQAPWVKEYEDAVNNAVSLTASKGGSLDISKATVDTTTECKVAETDIKKLN